MSAELGLPIHSKENHSSQSTNVPSSLVADHAQQLIDEVFQGLEDDLSSRSSLRQLPPAKRDSALVPLTSQLPDAELVVAYEPIYDIQPALRTVEPSAAPDHNPPHLLFFGLTCLTCLASLGLWIATASRPKPVMVVEQPPALPKPEPSALQFADTIEASLKAIEPKVLPKAAPVPAATVATAKPVAVPPALPVKPVAPAPVAVPPAKPAAPPARAVIALPKPASPVPVAQTPKAAPKKVAAAPQAKPSQPEPAPSEAAAAKPPAPPPMASAKSSNVMVQGILDFGDKSAMLIERNGSSQQVPLGGTLDGTGWVFQSIANRRAVIQRGDEVRSIGEGEQF